MEILNNIEKLDKNLDLLNFEFDTVGIYFNSSENLISRISQYEKKLYELDDSILMIKTQLIQIKIIPELESKIDLLERILDERRENITNQKIYLDSAFNKFIDPTKSQIGNLKNNSRSLTKMFNNLIICITEFKNWLFISRNDFSTENIAKTILVDINDLINKILEIITDIKKQIIIFDNKTIHFDLFIGQISNANDSTNKLIDSLALITETLDQTVVVTDSNKFKAKIPTIGKVQRWVSDWKMVIDEVTTETDWEWQTEEQSYVFSIGEIIKGIDHVNERVGNKLKTKAYDQLIPAMNGLDFDQEIATICKSELIQKELESFENHLLLNFMGELEIYFSDSILEFEKLICE